VTAFGRCLDACGRLCRFAAGGALALLLVLLVALVLGRYLALSLPWADEIARLTFVWMVAFGAASGLNRRAHFALNVIAERASPARRIQLERIVSGLTALVLVLLLVSLESSLQLVRHSIMPGTGLSRGWLQAPLAIFALLGALFMARHALAPRTGADG